MLRLIDADGGEIILGHHATKDAAYAAAKGLMAVLGGRWTNMTGGIVHYWNGRYMVLADDQACNPTDPRGEVG
jgi:hypothetical protein